MYKVLTITVCTILLTMDVARAEARAGRRAPEAAFEKRPCGTLCKRAGCT
jgi:hypothetical protein